MIELVLQWFLLAGFLIEGTAKLALNWEHQIGIVEETQLYDEISDRQRGTALTVASLVFAGIALILAEDPSQFATQIEIFVVAFGFLLVAAFAHELTLTRRIVLTIQEMALEYGLLYLTLGVFWLVVEVVPDARLVMSIVFFVVVVFRLITVPGELRAHANQ